MLSCTEFIPAYSELFKYLDRKDGRQAVYDYWKAIFTPNPDTGLYAKLTANDGKLRGCWDYWKHTLNEEAADFTIILDEEEGWYINAMHWCPSKGRLLKLKEQGMDPFEEYCKHCDGYKQACDKFGLDYYYDFTDCDKAACNLLITDPKIFKGDVEKILEEARNNPNFGKDCPNQF